MYFYEFFECARELKEQITLKKLLLKESKCSLFLAKADEEKVYYLELNKNILFLDNGRADVEELLAVALKKIIKDFCLKRDDLIMVVGLGNEGLTADTLGVKSLELLKVSAHLKSRNGYGNICAFSPSVSGVTGIESVEVIKALTLKLSPKLIICIDTLACSSSSRLGTVIQIKDNGLTPGAGVENAKPTLNKAFLGVPVIGIGVPLVMQAKNILVEYLKDSKERIDFNIVNQNVGNLIITPKEVDLYVKNFGEIIAKAINIAVHGKKI